jgi:hypothetical protein
VIVEAFAPLLAVIGLGDALIEVRLALGEPVVPVAVMSTGLPVIPAGVAVAVRVFGPGVVLSVQDVAVAIPSEPVRMSVLGSTVPLLRPVANVTSTPGTGLPLASRRITEGGEATGVPAAADWVVGLFAAIDDGVPAVRVIEPDTTLVSPDPPKLSV